MPHLKTIKTCQYGVCGKKFLGTKRQVFCSPKCRIDNWEVFHPRLVGAPKPVAAYPLPGSPITEKFWLSIDEAAEYSGLPKSELLERCRNGGLRSMKFGGHIGWRIHRASLEAL